MKKEFLTVALSVLLLASCGTTEVASIATSSSTDVVDTSTSEATSETTSDEVADVFTTEEDEAVEVTSGVSAAALVDYSDEFSDTDIDTTYEVDESVDLSTLTGTYTITDKGTYEFTGSAENVQIYVENETDDKIHIILNGVTISNDSLACIFVKDADKVYITSAADSVNTLTNTGTVIDDEDDEDYCGVYSKKDAVFNGSGTININSEYIGIRAKDDLKFAGGTVNVVAVDHGVKANDSVRVTLATLNIVSGEDGIHAENDDLESYVYIQDGAVNIESGDQGITASFDFTIAAGELNIDTEDEGIEATQINILGGIVNIESADDALNGSSDITDAAIYVNIAGGETSINAAGDGIDSNGDLYIAGGYTKIVQVADDNGPIDYDGTASVTGGTLIAVGSTNNAETTTSTVQGTIQTVVDGSGDIAVRASDDTLIAAIATDASYEMIFVTSPDLAIDNTYGITSSSTTDEVELTSLNFNDVISTK